MEKLSLPSLNQPIEVGYNYLKTLYTSNASPTIVELYEDKTSGTLVILKKLRKSMLFTQYQAQSAQREIRIHRMLHHPNIAELYDSSETDNDFLLLIEFIPRHDYFTEKIEINNKPFNMKPDGDVEKLRSFSLDILRGLDYLHSHGVIHMDMKPANLMVKPVQNQDEYPIVKIADFGLSRFLAENGFAYIEKKCGTDKYVAPEVKDGSNVTCAVDIWAFGLILYLLTVGFLPFALKWMPGQQLKFMPRHWKKYDNTGLTNLIEQCLQLDPVKRITASQALHHEWFSCQF
ncbi:hypothetical protein SteCoe_34994 [Stentor coeruleus]|uniref:Protein kinase domain-containing protein n=1 Tax=Stentor coeruleus TaxID=5963 RepID=A0A1R2ATA7_9CILI|nr:hypothetical protein SteCoe_34994 [Stentor coeruleus]